MKVIWCAWAVTVSVAIAACSSSAPQNRTSAPAPAVVAPASPSPPGVAQVGGSDPPEVAARFYAAYKTISHSGIPGASDRAKIEPYITAELDKLLIDAGAADAARPASKRFKGDPFTSKAAGATSIDLGRSCNWGGGFAGDSGVCLPHLSNASGAWDDQLLVVDKYAWLVDDVAYGGTDPSDHKGKLTDLLQSVIGKP